MASQVKVRPQSLLRSTTLVASMTFISRILGFVRDMVIAQIFGAGFGVDAYLVAFKIPSFMRRLFAEGAFSQAFVPVLSEYREKKTHAEVKAFINHMLGLLGTVLLIVTLLAMLFSPLLVHVFAPGFHVGDPRYLLTAHMLRVTFPYLLFISLAAMCAAILNSYGSFGVPAFTPVLLNLSLIVAALWFRHYFTIPIYALAWGVFFAGILQFSFQLPFLRHKDLLPRPSLQWHDPGVKRVLWLMIPALFGVSVAQINILVDTIFASFLPVGSVSWLYFSDRLSQFPLGVFGVAIATVILPLLSRRYADQDPKTFANTIDWAMRCVLFIGVPSALGLTILAGPTLATLFHYGRFGDYDVIMSQQSLWAFSLGIPAFMLIKILAAGFYARQDIKTPVKIGVISLITNTCLNFILIFPLQHAGLALSTTIAAYVNAGLLLFGLIKRDIYHFKAHWLSFMARLLLAVTGMSAALFYLSANINTWLAWPWQHRMIMLAFLIILAFLLYFSIAFACGMRKQHFKPHSLK